MIAVDEGDVEDLSRRLFGVSTGARHPSAIIQSFLLPVSDEHVWCFPTYVGQSRRSPLASRLSPSPQRPLTSLLFRKTPWKLSVTRKANARARLKKVDAVIEAVRESGVHCNALVSQSTQFVLSVSLESCFTFQEKALQLPKEHEMNPKDKYTVFSATSKGYRKGIHKVPKWTRVSSFLSTGALHIELKHYLLAYTKSKPQGFLGDPTSYHIDRGTVLLNILPSTHNCGFY